VVEVRTEKHKLGEKLLLSISEADHREGRPTNKRFSMGDYVEWKNTM
jgi:hypothetical protein